MEEKGVVLGLGKGGGRRETRKVAVGRRWGEKGEYYRKGRGGRDSRGWGCGGGEGDDISGERILQMFFNLI